MAYHVDAAPLLLCRTGWMTLYDGDHDTWEGGHRYPREHHASGEAWNFSRTPGDHVYGYVQNVGERDLNITRLGAVPAADRVEGVTIVWCSRRKDSRTLFIHGWYENAVVFRSPFNRPDGHTVNGWAVTAYFEAAADDAQLLAPEERTFPIPSHRKGAMGQSDFIYVGESNAALASNIRNYLHEARPSTRRPAPAPGVPPDSRGWGGGESAQHLALKRFVKDNPECLDVGLTRKDRAEEEHVLPSLDGIDVVFWTHELNYAVEVKPRNCGDSEHLRGIFQCVKYQALMQAKAKVDGKQGRCAPILVTEDPLSAAHQRMAKTLNILHRQIRLEARRSSPAKELENLRGK